MNIPPPLTDGQHAQIRARHALLRRHLAKMVPALNVPEFTSLVEAAAGDVAALSAEIERVADHLSTCWMAMEETSQELREFIAAQPDLGVFARRRLASIAQDLEAILTKQGMPGWKTRKPKEPT